MLSAIAIDKSELNNINKDIIVKQQQLLEVLQAIDDAGKEYSVAQTQLNITHLM